MRLLSKNKLVNCFNILLTAIPVSLLFSPALNSVLIGLLTFWSVLILFFKEGITPKLSRKYKIVFSAYLIFLAFHVITIFYSSDQSKAFALLRIRLPLLLILIIFYANYKFIKKNIILKCYVYGVAIASLFTFFNALYSLFLNRESLGFFFNYYVRYFYISFMPYEMHPTYFGLFLCSALAISLNFIVKKKNVLIHFFLCFIFLINIYLVSSQMILFVCALILFIYLMKTLRKVLANLYYKRVVLVILISVISLGFYGQDITRIIVKTFKIENKGNIVYRASHFFNQGDITRKKNWGSAYSVIQDNFLFGVGIGDGIDEMQKFREKKTWIYSAQLNAHNQYLEEFVHFGILGFICFIIFLFGGFYLTKDYLIFTSLFLVVICGMITESILNRQVGVTLFSFLLFFSLFSKKQLIIQK